MRRIWTAAGVCLLATLAAGDAHAASRLVAPGGSNVGNCTVNPCATIGYAMTQSLAGDSIDLAAGTYAEPSVNLTVPVTLRGAGPGASFIDSTSSVGLYVRTNGVTIRDLTLTGNFQAVRFEQAGGTFNNTELNNVHFTNNDRAIEVHNQTTVTDLRILNCLLDGTGSAAVRWASSAHGDGVLVSGSTFRNWSGQGIYEANDGSSGSLKGLTVTGCSFSNIAFAAIFAEEARDFLVENNTFTDCGSGFYLFKAYSTTGTIDPDFIDADNLVVRNNSFTGSRRPPILIYATGGAATNITIEGNRIAQDVGRLPLNYSLIDLRLWTGDGASHGPIDVVRNTVTLSGAFAGGAGATAVYGFQVRGGIGGVLNLTENVFDGGGVADGGGVPPLSNLFIRANDDPLNGWGPIDAEATVDISCNRITGAVNGISVFDMVAADYGGLAANPALGVHRNDIAGNLAYGLRHGDLPAGLLNAEDNWWGAASGPSPLGGGDPVAGNVDFAPFRAIPSACTPATARAVAILVDPGRPRSQAEPVVVDLKKKRIDVAVLSGADFDAYATIDQTSLRFGRTGDEASLLGCKKGPKDVNHDGFGDLLCTYDLAIAGLACGDSEAILKGALLDLTPVEGREAIQVEPCP